MYLKQLYQYNKILFFVIVVGLAFQVINNARQDVSFSPVYNYGMYSQVMLPQSEYIVPEIIVNGEGLQTKDFTPQEWDKIILPVTLFPKQVEWNRSICDNYVERLLHFSDSSHYVNHLTQSQFGEWYKRYLSGIIHKQISTLSVNFTRYRFGERKLNEIGILQTVPAQ